MRHLIIPDASYKETRNAKQRAFRKATNNSSTKKYEKTKSGFLMRVYRNMKSRVTGVQRAKYHLYAGCSLLPKDEFYNWANKSEIFNTLFSAWEQSGYDQKLTPSVDRISSYSGYELTNMEWVTHSENSRRGALNKYYGDWRSNEARAR